MLRMSLLIAGVLLAMFLVDNVDARDTFGTSFSFQGRLVDGGTPVNGSADFRFRLYTTSNGGAQVGSEQTHLSVAVSEGSFTVDIDFGASAFTGDPRWLEIDVRAPAGGGSYNTLAPRQEILPAAYAIRASSAPWAGLTGVPATFPPSSHDTSLLTSGTLDDARLSGNVMLEDANQTMTGDNFFMGLVGIGTSTPVQPLEAWGDVVIGGGQGGSTDGDSEYMSIHGESESWAIGAENTAVAADTGFFIGTTETDFDTFHLDRDGVLTLGTSVVLSPDSSGVGRVWTLGANGNLNTQLTNHSSSGNHGAVSVHNSSGNIGALMAIGSTGAGFISATIKNFRVANPQDPETEIVYACIEGPEAAAYMRGTATLVDGVAVVRLPQHFADVAVAAGMTVQLTPRSAGSLGLAVVSRSVEQFEVRELQNGTGTYEFDWEVKAVRAGFEAYEVIRPKLQLGS